MYVKENIWGQLVSCLTRPEWFSASTTPCFQHNPPLHLPIKNRPYRGGSGINARYMRYPEDNLLESLYVHLDLSLKEILIPRKTAYKVLVRFPPYLRDGGGRR